MRTPGVRSILFVCRANLCRSPMAEGVLRSMLSEQGAKVAFDVDSAGTHEFHGGRPPLAPAVDAAKQRGYDISGCLARCVTPADFERFDMILAMDKGNLDDLRKLAPTSCKHKIELLLDYGERHYGKEVPDPIGGDARLFDLALDMIEDGCSGVVQLLLRAA